MFDCEIYETEYAEMTAMNADSIPMRAVTPGTAEAVPFFGRGVGRSPQSQRRVFTLRHFAQNFQTKSKKILCFAGNPKNTILILCILLFLILIIFLNAF